MLWKESREIERECFKNPHPFGHGVLQVKIWFTPPISAGSESGIIKIWVSGRGSESPLPPIGKKIAFLI